MATTKRHFIHSNNQAYLRGQLSELENKEEILDNLSIYLKHRRFISKGFLLALSLLLLGWSIAILLILAFVAQISSIIQAISSNEPFWSIYHPLRLCLTTFAWLLIFVGFVRYGKPLLDATRFIIRYISPEKSVQALYTNLFTSRKVSSGNVTAVKKDGDELIIEYEYQSDKGHVENSFITKSKLNIQKGDKVMVLYVGETSILL